MSQTSAMRVESVIATLRRVAQPKALEEQCDFCSLPVGPVHRHLLELPVRKIICSCDPCAFRFQDVVGGRYKLIPRDARALPDFKISEAIWENFALPINLTFFYRDTAAGKVIAMYPSPAGATESLLSPGNWEALEADNPPLKEMQSDVEALLVNRIGTGRQYFIVPMDLCYELTGLIRMHWRGFSGGEKVWQEIDNFFAALREKADVLRTQPPEVGHA